MQKSHIKEQHTATQRACVIDTHSMRRTSVGYSRGCTDTRCNTLQHAATHCNTLQHAITHCNTLQHTVTHRLNMRRAFVRYSQECIDTHCNTLQHAATHCNTLQRTACAERALLSRAAQVRAFESRVRVICHVQVADRG